MLHSLPILSVLLLVTISVTCADPFSYKIDRVPNNDVIRKEILIATPSPVPNQETSPVTPTTTTTTLAPTTSSSTEAQSVATQTTPVSSSSSSTEAQATTVQNSDAVVIVNSAFENLSATTRKLGTPTTTRRPRPSTLGLTTRTPKPTMKPKPSKKPTMKPKPSKKPTTTRKPRPEISATAPVDCSADVEFWPHEECNKFIWCLHGEQVIQSCSGNLYWDFKQEKCDWPKKVDTSHCRVPPPTVNSPITTTTTTTTPVPPKDCDSEDEYFAHPDCDKYIWCVHGEPQTFACPGDLYWDNEKEECAWRKKVPSSDCNVPVKKNL